MSAVDEQTEAAKKMWDTAREHGDRYLLPRRPFGKGRDHEKDAEYETADWLVSMRYARWISWGSSFAPGVELTGKPWRETV